MFCAEHRYPDHHDCTYAYKIAGREGFTRDNPMVKAAKIEMNARSLAFFLQFKQAHMQNLHICQWRFAATE
ncbi:hypothetical protein L1987_48635 [Smallanthus sonchifolius]|uniref:Uncharacterized protein n=1 Tax=Smallanthus sonchifolius TaxID=185202 RepID=A0ACB9FSB5_9ASTR|nr:hypothetical protein L1987_48635 [Smallanthus sonchifolius]